MIKRATEKCCVVTGTLYDLEAAVISGLYSLSGYWWDFSEIGSDADTEPGWQVSSEQANRWASPNASTILSILDERIRAGGIGPHGGVQLAGLVRVKVVDFEPHPIGVIYPYEEFLCDLLVRIAWLGAVSPELLAFV